jgi:hypothetical protein
MIAVFTARFLIRFACYRKESLVIYLEAIKLNKKNLLYLFFVCLFLCIGLYLVDIEPKLQIFCTLEWLDSNKMLSSNAL